MVNISSSVQAFTVSVKAFLVCGVASIVLVPHALAQNASNAASSNEVAYTNLLEAISAKRISLAQQELFVLQQDAKIVSLNSQIDGLDDWKAAIDPMLGKMATGIAGQIKSDYPFEMDRRLPRLQSLENSMKDPAASVGDKYRKALNIYKLEVNYGKSLEAKKGNHPTSPTIRIGDDRWEKDEDGAVKLNKNGERIEIFDGSYLRYGRVAYVYLQADSTQAMRYDLAANEWVDLPKKSIADIRRGVKIASGEAAPNVVKVPLVPNP